MEELSLEFDKRFLRQSKAHSLGRTYAVPGSGSRSLADTTKLSSTQFFTLEMNLLMRGIVAWLDKHLPMIRRGAIQYDEHERTEFGRGDTYQFEVRMTDSQGKLGDDQCVPADRKSITATKALFDRALNVDEIAQNVLMVLLLQSRLGLQFRMGDAYTNLLYSFLRNGTDYVGVPNRLTKPIQLIGYAQRRKRGCVSIVVEGEIVAGGMSAPTPVGMHRTVFELSSHLDLSLKQAMLKFTDRSFIQRFLPVLLAQQAAVERRFYGELSPTPEKRTHIIHAIADEIDGNVQQLTGSQTIHIRPRKYVLSKALKNLLSVARSMRMQGVEYQQSKARLLMKKITSYGRASDVFALGGSIAMGITVATLVGLSIYGVIPGVAFLAVLSGGGIMIAASVVTLIAAGVIAGMMAFPFLVAAGRVIYKVPRGVVNAVEFCALPYYALKAFLQSRAKEAVPVSVDVDADVEDELDDDDLGLTIILDENCFNRSVPNTASGFAGEFIAAVRAIDFSDVQDDLHQAAKTAMDALGKISWPGDVYLDPETDVMRDAANDSNGVSVLRVFSGQTVGFSFIELVIALSGSGEIVISSVEVSTLSRLAANLRNELGVTSKENITLNTQGVVCKTNKEQLVGCEEEEKDKLVAAIKGKDEYGSVFGKDVKGQEGFSANLVPSNVLA